MRWNRALTIVVIGSLLAGCAAKPADSSLDESQAPTAETTTPSAPTLKGEAPTDYDQLIADNLTVARTKAKAWQEDAVLHYVSVELPADLAPRRATETFVFGSPKSAGDWWTYSLSEKSGRSIRATIPKDDYLGAAIQPINSQYWKMNYVEAFQLADANGGADFREANPDAKVTLYLSHREPRQWLWWTVEYKTPAGDVFTLLVNPNRGEVVDSTGTEIAPAPTAQ